MKISTRVRGSNAAGSFTGTYTAAGPGRYTFGSFSNFVGGTSYAAYPSSGGILLLEIDAPGLVAGITAGAAYPQTAGAAFHLPRLRTKPDRRQSFGLARG